MQLLKPLREPIDGISSWFLFYYIQFQFDRQVPGYFDIDNRFFNIIANIESSACQYKLVGNLSAIWVGLYMPCCLCGKKLICHWSLGEVVVI